MRQATIQAALAFVCAFAASAHAGQPLHSSEQSSTQQPSHSSELQQLDTDDLQLVWFHPAEDYIAPHVARSFENSIAWQKRIWGWVPSIRRRSTMRTSLAACAWLRRERRRLR